MKRISFLVSDEAATRLIVLRDHLEAWLAASERDVNEFAPVEYVMMALEVRDPNLCGGCGFRHNGYDACPDHDTCWECEECGYRGNYELNCHCSQCEAPNPAWKHPHCFSSCRVLAEKLAMKEGFGETYTSIAKYWRQEFERRDKEVVHG